VRGTVASAGFGNGVATPGNGAGGAGGRSRDAGPAQTPIEILFKPRPEYTQEARNKKLEGEVLVRALFTATGKVQVMEVVRGLGHGLDQNAVRAAQQIRFKPAQRDGQAVDMIATVHIVFQLAY
jgi:TonB family protein